MANTGYDWGAWAAVTYAGPNDITAYDLDDETTLTSLVVDLDGLAACEVSVKWTEGGDGAVDGDLYCYLLRDTDGTNFETINDNPWGFAIDVVASATRYRTFSVDPGMVGSFKMLFDNDSGRDGDLTVKYRTADIPVAS